MEKINVNEPIYSQDAEIACLGSVIYDGKVIGGLLQEVKTEDFYLTKHQKIFNSMKDMHHNDVAIDIVTLYDYLKYNGCFEEIGGYDYLTHLVQLTPTSANYKHYAGIVKEHSRLRQISDFSKDLSDKIHNAKSGFSEARQEVLVFAEILSVIDLYKLCHYQILGRLVFHHTALQSWIFSVRA